LRSIEALRSDYHREICRRIIYLKPGNILPFDLAA